MSDDWGNDPLVTTKGDWGNDPLTKAPAASIPTMTVRPTRSDDLMIPTAADAKRPDIKPEPQGVIRRVGRAVGNVWSEPLGPSAETMNAFGSSNPMLNALNRAVVGPVGTALDVVGRVGTSAVRGGAGAVAGLAEDAGVPPSRADRMEDDLNVAGDLATIETGRSPGAAVRPQINLPIKATAANAGRAVANAARPLANPAAAAMRWMWDVDPDKAAMAREINAGGGRVPIETWAPASTFLARITQVAKGFGYDPVGNAAVPFFEREAGNVLEAAGLDRVTDPGGLTGATSAAPIASAGTRAATKAREIYTNAQDALARRVQAFRDYHTARATDQTREAQRSISTEAAALVTEADASRRAAEALVREQIARIDRSTEQALRPDAQNAGQLMRQTETELRQLRQEFGREARRQYEAADAAAEGHIPNTEGLGQWARDTLDSLPPPVRAQYPREVQILSRLAEEDAGEVRPSGLMDEHGRPIPSAQQTDRPQITFGQLHELRNWVRHAIDYNDLTPGPKQGAYKFLERQIDAVLHDQEAAEPLQTAAHMLDQTDTWYGQNIARFKDSAVKAIVKSGTAAAPENAVFLANAVIGAENPARIAMLRDMLGGDTWGRILAADLRGLITRARDETGGVNPQEFAAEIAKRLNNGSLAAAHGEPAARTLGDIARRIQQVHGDFSVEVLPGDTVTTLMQRASNALDRAETIAAHDPMETLKTETAKINQQARDMQAKGMREVRQFPLRGVVSLEGEAAAKRILDNPDLLRASAAEFGHDSPEFTALRQAWARRFLQRDIEKTGRMRADLASSTRGLSEDVQQLLFPGVSKDQFVKLVERMEMIFPAGGGDETALGMMGMSAIMHPQNAAFMPGPVKGMMKGVPTMVARGVVAVTGDRLARLATNPEFVRFVSQGLSGSPLERRAADVALLSIAQGSTPAQAIRAASTAMVEQMSKRPDDQPQEQPPPAPKSWREMLNDPGGQQPEWRRMMQEDNGGH
jgi:hypothetical protein